MGREPVTNWRTCYFRTASVSTTTRRIPSTRQPSFPWAHLTIISLVRQPWPRTGIDGALPRRSTICTGPAGVGLKQPLPLDQLDASTSANPDAYLLSSSSTTSQPRQLLNHTAAEPTGPTP